MAQGDFSGDGPSQTAAGVPHRFRDRLHAARLLAGRLAHLRDKKPLILAVPRGGLPMGRLIADALNGELDVVLVHKLGAPGQREFAIGAIDENGNVHLSAAASRLDLDPRSIRLEADRQLAALRERRERYRTVRPSTDPAGRSVVVVDDGAATGETLLAALAFLRARAPERLTVALGVAPEDTVHRLEEIADEVACLLVPAPMYAVGLYYEDFSQVSDEQALQALAPRRS